MSEIENFPVIVPPDNYIFRKGNRTDNGFKTNILTGTQLQKEMFYKFISRHNEFVKQYPNCPLKIINSRYLVNEEINKGDHRDTLDGELFIQIKDNPPFWQKIEIEGLIKKTPFARFKKRKVLRCIEKKAPMFHFQLGIKVPMMYVLSVSDLIIMDKIGYKPEPIYDGSLAFKFDTSSPGPFLGVKWPSLDPLEIYKKCLGKIINL